MTFFQDQDQESKTSEIFQDQDQDLHTVWGNLAKDSYKQCTWLNIEVM